MLVSVAHTTIIKCAFIVRLYADWMVPCGGWEQSKLWFTFKWCFLVKAFGQMLHANGLIPEWRRWCNYVCVWVCVEKKWDHKLAALNRILLDSDFSITVMLLRSANDLRQMLHWYGFSPLQWNSSFVQNWLKFYLPEISSNFTCSIFEFYRNFINWIPKFQRLEYLQQC